ncbi:dsRBD fold-containing protein [Catellatospora sp. NPDC049609]|uniref:dsRBD fold-containing protein n=1 Tax=Catellatospora sp. NPDC049609 TaxID=3155505 RepID=UPI00341C7829
MTTATMTKTLMVELRFEEDVDVTRAVASMRLPNGRLLTGEGHARRNPVDRPRASIGEEMAGARALSGLAHRLLEAAADEVESNVHGGDPVV